MKSIFCLSVAFIFLYFNGFSQLNGDEVLGKWKTIKGDLIVDVYKVKLEYKAKVVWFNVKTKPMDFWKDDKNPDPKLRNRKLLGMDIVNNLHFNNKSKEWEGGKIYDPTTGKTWDSIAWITKDQYLKVKGYWLFQFLSKTLVLKKIG